MDEKGVLGSVGDIKAWLRQRALDLGFVRVGFASTEPFEVERPRLQAWFAEGRGELLPYLQEGPLLDPQAVLPGVRSALVAFFPYARPGAIPGQADGSLKLSRYTWGPDYHTILKGRLSRLLREAQALYPDLAGRVCVDTTPLLERQLAARAGLGWQGRHTLLIAGKAGSWGFLGVLLLNLDLEPDRPFTGHRCGTCTACLEACPTGALEPFKLDPALCLTTYNLETEAEPPAKVREAIAATGWVAGCDQCQECCPWNRQPVWGDPELWGGASPFHGVPTEELPRSTAQFQKHARQTSLRRVRHRRWLQVLGWAGARAGQKPTKT